MTLRYLWGTTVSKRQKSEQLKQKLRNINWDNLGGNQKLLAWVKSTKENLTVKYLRYKS